MYPDLMGNDLSRNQDTDDTVTEMVTREVAKHERVDPVALKPRFNNVVDADALESLLSHSAAREYRSDIRIEFSYCGYDIAVEGDRTVEIQNE